MGATAPTFVQAFLRLGERTPKLRAETAEGGYAAVDALVAATILTSTMVLAINAGFAARQASRAAFETRRAANILRYLLETDRSVGSGEIAGFRWDVSTSRGQKLAGTILQACDREVNARSVATGRRYHLKTDVPCPPEAQ